MSEYVELINAVVALIGALAGVIVMILNARRNRNMEFVKLIEMLQTGKPLNEALKNVALSAEDVRKKAEQSPLGKQTVTQGSWKGTLRDALKKGVTEVTLDRIRDRI